jgi:hypothetical protein
MINYHQSSLTCLSIHQIGQKAAEEGVQLSEGNTPFNEQLAEILLKYFFSHFQKPEFYTFTFTDNQIELNPVFARVSKIFENPETLHENSIFLAKHLYAQSDHPNIKSGDLMVAHVKEIMVDDEMVDAIVILKSESKEDFLKLQHQSKNFTLNSDKGININQLDKGCIILNTEKESGYKLCIIDHLNKNRDAVYWKSDFLKVKARADNYHSTAHYIQMTKSFVKDRLKPLYELDKTEEAVILNRSKEFFKNQEEFDQEEYEFNVFKDAGHQADFKDYLVDYQEEKSVVLPTTFSISEEAFKNKSAVFRSILKLDKNFHVYIHGKRDMIEKGVDENGRKYYKIYYETES